MCAFCMNVDNNDQNKINECFLVTAKMVFMRRTNLFLAINYH